MLYTTLGRTKLRVSRVGLGCGGPSRLGQSYGRTDTESKRVIFRALELGISFFDTAETYGTEALLGDALAEARAGADVVVSTKKGVWDWARAQLCSPQEMLDGLHASLKRLKRERLDVYHVHGLELRHVDYAMNDIVPVLRAAQAEGKIGHLAVSEAFMSDTRHLMLQRVLDDDVFDVAMVGFNLLNPSARKTVFPVTRERGVATLIMFAARLRDADQSLAFLGDVQDAAYRFCAHEPGADVVLTGTGSVEHLEQNVKALLDGPLEGTQLNQLERLFGSNENLSLE
jgi:L-galactose dehydrogenase